MFLPADYLRIQCVSSFEALVSTPLAGDVNALCWVRQLEGDFDAVARALDDGAGGNMGPVEDVDLHALAGLSPRGRLAVECLLEDRAQLSTRGLDPTLDCIKTYPRDELGALVATDVHSFHVDRAPFATDTYLCSYNFPTSEILRNDQAQRKVDIPEIRSALLALSGARDEEQFREYLADHSFDLHYQQSPAARPIACGVGNLWRIACLYPNAPVPPCIHRAPVMISGQPRLLLIS